MRPAIREKKKSPRLRKSLCCSTTDTLVSYRGLNQSEIVKGGPPLWLAVVQIFLYVCVRVWRCVCFCCQTQREVSSRDARCTQLFLWICSVQWASDSPSRILRSLNISQNQANSAIFADFALRRVLWRHRNAHSVKERLFLSSKNGMNSFAFSSCPIYKS